ncbi:MAG: LPXTG cell wall anchor domain-containing protein [Actinobacteria bacterium]|nr:MAG: LPXTG cell wall anchor domain-containing protein [Actinomycetota bacterium]
MPSVAAPTVKGGKITCHPLPKPAPQGKHLPATGVGDNAALGVVGLILAIASRRWMRRTA